MLRIETVDRKRMEEFKYSEMTEESRKKFFEELEEKCPEFLRENTRAIRSFGASSS